jgi:hypothetical protein
MQASCLEEELATNIKQHTAVKTLEAVAVRCLVYYKSQCPQRLHVILF